ncbi:unnamed protein product [Caenorhabditis bovis]|uniref:MATH domain-containing protein n=1 Tax=Caenorhabditis bovis TaxID=2654633 RepID=A0A8S1F3X6_9PELO|nr:unnamed protein product [Caenorhabditis bovis]
MRIELLGYDTNRNVNLHLVLLCKSLNPIRSNAIRQQAVHINEYVQMFHSMDEAEAVFNKYSSQHIFHIPNIGLAVVKASKNKSHRKIFSQEFYTHGYGYKMLCVAAPYGDGKALREHFSIFVCLLKGDNDDVLAWPFRCPVTFTLLANDPRKNVRKVYNPADHADAKELFEKPVGLRNPAFGFQNFVELSAINEYALGNDFFIEIHVALRPDDLQRGKQVDSSKCQGFDIDLSS